MSKPTTRSVPSPLGDFGKLSPELRVMIMKRCANRRCAVPLLQTSSALHNELKPFLTNGLVLTLDVDPASPWTHVEILNEEGRPWSSGEERTLIDLASVHHKPSTKSQLHRIPLQMLDKLNVDIQAPNPRDPGQLARAWLQVTRLIDWMSPYNTREGELRSMVGNRLLGPLPSSASHISKGLPEICVRLSGHEMDWWREGDFNASIKGPIHETITTNTGRQVGDDLFQECDLDILLQPFQRIRHARSLSVKLPARLQNLDNPALADLINRLSIVGEWQTDFGTRIDHELERQREENLRKLGTLLRPVTFEISESLSDPCIDNYIQQIEDSWTIWIDNCLDDLEGKTAGFVRRERFSQWCQTYEKTMRLALGGTGISYVEAGQFLAYSIGGPSKKMISEAQHRMMTRSWDFDRPYALKLLNPVSWERAEPRQGPRLDPPTWCRAAWFYGYPEGIPPKSSQEYRDLVHRLTNSRWYTSNMYRAIDFKCLHCLDGYDRTGMSLDELLDTR